MLLPANQEDWIVRSFLKKTMTNVDQCITSQESTATNHDSECLHVVGRHNPTLGMVLGVEIPHML